MKNKQILAFVIAAVALGVGYTYWKKTKQVKAVEDIKKEELSTKTPGIVAEVNNSDVLPIDKSGTGIGNVFVEAPAHAVEGALDVQNNVI